MLKAPDHQVAGHQAIYGKLGPLIDDSGRFYKPLQDDHRGAREASFYKSISSDSRVPSHIRRFFPVYYGTKLVEASDGSGLHPHLVLEDVVRNYDNPCIMDIKVGSRTWYPQASEDYILKCLKKDKESTSLSLGFRLSGVKVYVGGTGEESLGYYWKPGKKEIQRLNVDEARLVLKRFVSNNNHQAEATTTGGVAGLEKKKHTPDCALASHVYGGPDGILSQLMELKSWFEDQTTYHFCSCSVLMVYDMESVLGGGESRAAVKLIDFSHVFEGDGVIDHNFLGGLCSLIQFISEVLKDSDGCLPLEDWSFSTDLPAAVFAAD